MQSTLFTSRIRNGVAIAASLLALLAITAYVGSPGDAIAAKLTATYRPAHAARALVEGVVKSPNGRPDRHGEVAVTFRGANGAVIERKLVKVNKNGQFYIEAPKGARTASLTAYLRPGKKAPHGSSTVAVVPGKAASVTVIFHHTGGGVLPAVFPY